MGMPDIKVVTGIRRSGKSKLLEMFIGYLKESRNNINIIEINLNLKKNEGLKTADALYNHIDSI